MDQDKEAKKRIKKAQKDEKARVKAEIKAQKTEKARVKAEIEAQKAREEADKKTEKEKAKWFARNGIKPEGKYVQYPRFPTYLTPGNTVMDRTVQNLLVELMYISKEYK